MPIDPELEELASGFPPTDESGDVDLFQMLESLRLTPAERIERHYQARVFFEQVRKAGEKFYGSPHPDPEAA